MPLPLPFTTFDQVRELGYSARLYCRGCHRDVLVDLDDPRLAGKTFAGARFICSNVIHRWTASPARICGTLACVTIYPPADKVVRPSDHGVMYCSLGCPRCMPGWGINQARPDDPLWRPLSRKPFGRYRCPTCRAMLGVSWHGWDTRPHHLQAATAKVATSSHRSSDQSAAGEALQ